MATLRLLLADVVNMHPQQLEHEWHMVGLDIGLIGQLLARCWIGTPEALRWNAYRILGVGR